MRVAICLHGLSLGRNILRDITRSNPDTDWKRYTESIFKNLIDLNNADIFLHTWEHEETQDILKCYKPKLALIESQKQFNSLFNNEVLDYDKENYHSYVTNNYSPIVYAHPRLFSHTYSFDRADSLRQSYEITNGFKYDFVIKLRFDLQILKPINLQDFNSNKIQIGKWWGSHNVGMEDLLIIAGSDNMTKVSSLYHKMYEYHIEDEYNTKLRSMGLGAFHFSSPHELFHYHFEKMGLLNSCEEIFEREIHISLDRGNNFNFMETNRDE
jgi:hypothetical protein